MEVLSSVAYLRDQVQALVDEAGSIKAFCAHSGIGYDTIHRILHGGVSCRLSTVERLGRCAGKSVGEMFLQPGLETDWYVDAHLDYLPGNLMTAMEAEQMDVKVLSAALEMPTTAVTKFLEGTTKPMTDTLEKLAEALNEEVADLFLPPDGSE